MRCPPTHRLLSAPNSRLEALIQQKEKVMQDVGRREGKLEDEFRQARSRLEADHAHAIAIIENQLAQITAEQQSDKQVCKATLLAIKTTLTYGAYFHQIVWKIWE